MILYRPVGLQELELIYDGGMKAFPARLPQQPIFYPVLDLEYARQTASDWNAKSGQFAGYVTQFNVEDKYIKRFEKHTVGGSQHQEFWIPAEELEEFNKHITGHIRVVEAHFGSSFQGFVPDKFGLQGKNAAAQFTEIANSFLYKRMDFYLEIKRNHKAIFLNYPFWQTHKFKNQGLKEKVLQAIREAWLTSFPKTPLVSPLPEETPSVDDPDSSSSVNPDRAETPKKETNIRSPMKPVRMENRPAEQPKPHFFIKSAPKNHIHIEKDDSDLLAKPLPDKISPAQKEDSSPVEPDQGGTPPVKRTTPHFLVNRVPEDASPQRPTISHFAQGVAYGLSGKYNEAIEELSKAVNEHPDRALAYTSLGVAYHRLNDDDRALSCYETALKMEPKSAETLYFQANILYSRGNVQEAVAGYTTAIGQRPELVGAHQNPIPQDRLTDYTPSPAGIHRIATPARRILDLSKALETDPEQAEIFRQRAAEYYRLGNYEQVIADYGSSLALQPDDAGALHFRGLAYEQLGQLERAQEDYQQATAIDPQLSNVYLDRGITLGRMGNFRQSIASLTDGIRLAPTNPNGYFNRGATYLQLGDFENAIADFSNVIQLSSNDEDAYYWRGISHEEAGHRREAVADYRQFLSISQNARAKEEIEQKLNYWNEGKQSGVSSRNVTAEEGKESKKDQTKRQVQDLDLYELISTLGERALESVWLGSDVDCYGEGAKELFSFTNQNLPMQGPDFLRIASGIRQTMEGDFQAFDPGAASPWIFIRAWKGSGFYIETNDPKIKIRLKAHFQSIEEVEGASLPYEGLFISI